MIIFRYLTREILLTMSAVAGVLLLVIMGSRFIRYFTSAADGDIPVSILGTLMLFHMPGFLELILPLSFFLGILLAYGQLYLNSEITVLVACGTSPNRLLTVTLLPALIVAALVGACSMWLTPTSSLHNELLLEEQRSNVDFSSLTPGRFQSFGSGRTAYANDVDEDDRRLQEVFISESQKRSDGTPENVVTRASLGYQTTDEDTGSRYLVLEDGERYSVEAGRTEAERLEFGTYAVRLTRASEAVETDDAEFATTTDLLKDIDDPEAMAQLQWRLGAPVMVLILTLLAMPLSKVNPRQGRFAKLLPAIFIYVAYLSLLLATMDAVGKGKIPGAIGMWPIHLAFLAIGLLLTFNAQRKGMSG